VKGSRVLDIPCGNGRHSLEFAKRGYAMSCIDLSDEFIAEARQSANANGVHLDECIRMDIRDINFQERFDGAFCFGNSFGYLDREANAKFLKNISRSLKPGAKFVVETGLAAESLLPGLQARRWYRFGDIIALSENRYDTLASELHTDYTFIRGGSIECGTALDGPSAHERVVGEKLAFQGIVTIFTARDDVTETMRSEERRAG